MLKVVINADDFGMTDGICRAIRELFDSQAISSTSVMIAAPGARERCRRWGLPALRGTVGVHLQLTGGQPVFRAGATSPLADPTSGNFRADINHIAPETILEEWRSQIDLAADLIGAPPSHLDSHHGVHLLPNAIDVYLTLAREYGVPVRGGEDVGRERMHKASVTGTDHVLVDWTGRDLSATDLKEQLLSIATSAGQSDSIDVVTHPGYCDAALVAASSLNKARENDRLTLLDLAAEGWLLTHSFVLASYSELSRSTG